MTSARELVRRARAAGLRLAVEGDELVVDGPEEARAAILPELASIIGEVAEVLTAGGPVTDDATTDLGGRYGHPGPVVFDPRREWGAMYERLRPLRNRAPADAWWLTWHQAPELARAIILAEQAAARQSDPATLAVLLAELERLWRQAYARLTPGGAS